MNKLYLINNKISEIPIYWTARYSNRIINQIDDKGIICEKWSQLPIEDLEYWGVVSNFGTYGFYPKENICDMNGTKLRFESDNPGKLSYKRTIVSSSEGWTNTKSVEIGFFNYLIKLNFIPELNIVFMKQE